MSSILKSIDESSELNSIKIKKFTSKKNYELIEENNTILNPKPSVKFLPTKSTKSSTNNNTSNLLIRNKNNYNNNQISTRVIRTIYKIDQNKYKTIFECKKKKSTNNNLIDLKNINYKSNNDQPKKILNEKKSFLNEANSNIKTFYNKNSNKDSIKKLFFKKSLNQINSLNNSSSCENTNKTEKRFNNFSNSKNILKNKSIAYKTKNCNTIVNSNKKINFPKKSKDIFNSPEIENIKCIKNTNEKERSNSDESKKITEPITKKVSAINFINSYRLRKDNKLFCSGINNIGNGLYSSRSAKIRLKFEDKEVNDQYYCKDCVIF